MKARFLIVVLAVFLVGTAGIVWAGGMNSSGASKHSMAEKANVSPPIMVSTDYLEYLEIENGLETGTLTEPGVHPTTQQHARPVEKTAEASPPVMVPNDYLEYLEFENGIETGSLTSPGVHPTKIAGPSTRVETPEGG
ncbi:MAG: hypothetical protein WBG20_03900 [Candidatus Deferrimicrobiaceae bacterium]